jgi:hypothetical protein
MIELNDDESMLLLITKNWEHKDVKKHKDESKTDYISRVCKFRCYGDSETKWEADVYSIYSSLAEKVLTVRQLLQSFERVEPTNSFFKLTKSQAIISAISILPVKNDKGEVLIKFNYDLIDPKDVKQFFKDEELEKTN